MRAGRSGKAAFSVLLAATMITNVASTMLVPLVPDLIGLFRMSAIAIGLAFTAFPFARAVVQPISGVFVDRSRRLVTLTSASLLTIAITVTGLGFAHSGTQVILWRLAWGGAAGIAIPAIYRLMFLLAPQAGLTPARATSRFGSAAVSGMAAGPALVWLLRQSVGFSALFVIGGFCTALSAALLALFVRPSPLTSASQPGETGHLERPSPGRMALLGLVTLFGLIDLINNGAYAALEPILPIYLHQLTGPAASGLTSVLFTSGLIVFALVSAGCGRKIERFAELGIAAVALWVAGATMLVIAASRWVAVIGACFLLFMATQPVLYVVNRRGVNRVPADLLGRAFGFFGLLSDLGFIGGPIVGAALFSRLGTASFALLGVTLTAAALLCIALRDIPDRLLVRAHREAKKEVS